MQQRLGVDQPDYGSLFADAAYEHGAQVLTARLIAPKVEAEVALVIERDGRDVERPSVADVIGATAYAVAAIEIVDSRIRNWDIKLVDTIADNASGAAFVLGCQPAKLGTVDLELAGMQMLVNGQPRVWLRRRCRVSRASARVGGVARAQDGRERHAARGG